MKIYRIEGPKGRGVCLVTGSPLCLAYRLGAVVAGEPAERERCEFPCKAEGCKAFDATALGTDEAIRFHMRYAFPSLAALADWFPGPQGRAAMGFAGAQGLIFDVPSLVATGPYQVVFDKRLATEAGRFNLETLAPL